MRVLKTLGKPEMRMLLQDLSRKTACGLSADSRCRTVEIDVLALLKLLSKPEMRMLLQDLSRKTACDLSADSRCRTVEIGVLALRNPVSC